MAGMCIPSSLEQSGCFRLSPIQSNSHGNRTNDEVIESQNDSDCFMLATSRVVPRSAEPSGGLSEGNPSVSN